VLNRSRDVLVIRLERALGREGYVNPRSDLVNDFVGGAAKVFLNIFFSISTQHCLSGGALVFFQFREVFSFMLLPWGHKRPQESRWMFFDLRVLAFQHLANSQPIRSPNGKSCEYVIAFSRSLCRLCLHASRNHAFPASVFAVVRNKFTVFLRFSTPAVVQSKASEKLKNAVL